MVAAFAVTAVVVSGASALADQGEPVVPVAEAESFGAYPVAVRSLQVPAISVEPVRAQTVRGTPTLAPSALSDLDIPPTALLAYRRAADVIAQADDSCGLSWTLLAAIGRVETDHGRYRGARLMPDGTSKPAIRGVALDGTGAVARIRDTDDGQLDGDPVWDRAVGPMQFLPSTWSVVGVDADGDSVRSPDSIADAALAAAVFLCSAPGDLTTPRDLRAAIFRYNPSRSYVTNVLRIERSYRADELRLPARFDQSDWVALPAASPDPAVGDESQTSDPGDAADAAGALEIHALVVPPGKPDQAPTTPPAPVPTDTPDLEPVSDPSPEPDPSQDPSPEPIEDPAPSEDPEPESDPEPSEDPQPESEAVHLVGLLTVCDSGWCLDELPLDVGDADFLLTLAVADFDADGQVESNSDELTGLVDTKVEIDVAPDTAPALVLALNDMAYVKR
ncbi:hypothetical protein GCM10027020_18340 [Nocardioides salsibiostraticola]